MGELREQVTLTKQQGKISEERTVKLCNVFLIWLFFFSTKVFTEKNPTQKYPLKYFVAF